MLAAVGLGCGSSYHCDAECLSRRRAAEACTAGDVDRCEALGHYDRACELGSAYGCYAAAQKVDPRETIIDDDASAALGYYQRGCEAGYTRACHRGGTLALTLPSVDLGKGRELLARACDEASRAPGGGERPPKLTPGGSTVEVVPRNHDQRYHREAAFEACRELSLALADGVDGATDDARAHALMTAACGGGADQACTFVAYYQYAGIGVPPDQAAALERFKQSCENKDGDACSAAQVLREDTPTGTVRVLARLLDGESHEFSLRAAAVQPHPLPPTGVRVEALSFISMSGRVSISGGHMTAVKGRLIEATPTRMVLAEQRSQNILRIGYTTGDLMLLRWAAPNASLEDDDCGPTEDCRERGMCGAAEGYCATTAAGCRQASICRSRGACQLVGGRCTVGSTDDCRQSSGCRNGGRCRAEHGWCVR